MKQFLIGIAVILVAFFVMWMIGMEMAWGGTFEENAIKSHNDIRNSLNRGKLGDQPIPNPFIKNMYWDQSIAENAQRHANKCIWEHSDAWDRDYAGENIAAGYGTMARAVDAWASEERNYDYETNTSNGVTGHYTQLVWHDSTRLGCGVAQCSPLKRPDGSTMWNGDFIVCQYKAAGNYYNQRPYSVAGDYTGAAPSYNRNTEELNIPFVEVDGASYRAKLQLVTDKAPYKFALTAFEVADGINGEAGGYGTATYSSASTELYLPVIKIDNNTYDAVMRYKAGYLTLVDLNKIESGE